MVAEPGSRRFTIAALTDVPEDEQGLAAGVQNAALQIGGGLGLAAVSSAVALTSGGGSTPAELVGGIRVGAVVGAALPLVGAGVALLFPSHRWAAPEVSDAADQPSGSGRR